VQHKDPLLRFGVWLDAEKILTTEAQTATRQGIDEEIRAAITAEESAGPTDGRIVVRRCLGRPSWLLDEPAGRVPARAASGGSSQ